MPNERSTSKKEKRKGEMEKRGKTASALQASGRFGQANVHLHPDFKGLNLGKYKQKCIGCHQKRSSSRQKAANVAVHRHKPHWECSKITGRPSAGTSSANRRERAPCKARSKYSKAKRFLPHFSPKAPAVPQSRKFRHEHFPPRKRSSSFPPFANPNFRGKAFRQASPNRPGSPPPRFSQVRFHFRRCST